jgi:hypothetical protein
MIRRISTLIFAAAALFSSCKKDKTENTCTFPADPTLEDVRISVLEDSTGKDVLVPNRIDPNNIKVIQTCAPHNTIDLAWGSATTTDSSQKTLKSFSFKNLTEFYNGEDCKKLTIAWTNTDVDVLEFVMTKQRCAGNCCINFYPRIILNGVEMSPGGVEGKDSSGVYFLLRK